LAGQCGKLKCCLNYELDIYLEALKDFPSQDTRLYTSKGPAFCQKTDIFKKTMWFSYKDEPSTWHPLTTDQVHGILEKNRLKEDVGTLEQYAAENLNEEKMVFENSVGQDSLTRFDRPKRHNKRNKNRKGRKNKKRTSKNA
jgi:cell fate regulator YaaT (PSP1 superfamily)